MKKIFLAVLLSICAVAAIGQTHFNNYFIPDSSCGNVNLNQDSIHQHLYSTSFSGYSKQYSNGNDYVYSTAVGFPRHIINQQCWSDCSTSLIQQFLTDNTLVVRGIAAYIIYKSSSSVPCLNCTFDLRDANHNVIDSLRWDTIGNFETYNTGGGWYEFMFSKDYKIYPGVFGIGASTEYPFNVLVPGLTLLGCKTDSYTSPLPILGIWEDSILPISSSYVYTDTCFSTYNYPDLSHSTLFLFPILAWQDTIPQDTSSLQNAQVEQYSYLYPNPAQEEITIACSFKIQTIEVYNITGQRVEERKVNSYTTKLNTQSYSKGAYTCKIKTDNGLAVKKFVVR